MNNPLYNTTTNCKTINTEFIATILQDNPAYAGNNDTVVDDAICMTEITTLSTHKIYPFL